MRSRDGATTKRERMSRIIQLVKDNPGIQIRKIQAEIAWKTGLNYKTVSRYVQELVDVGILVETEQGFKAGRTTPIK